MTKHVIFRVLFLSLGILLIAGASYGQTQINGAASGNWSNTASWSPATVPNNGGGNTYDVTLLSSPAVDITLDISPTIDTLTLDSGSELTANASMTLTTTGLTNAGYISFGNGNTLTVNGTTTTSGSLILGDASTGKFNGSLTNSSTFETYGGSTATVSGAFTNSSGGFVDLESTGDVLNVGSLSNNSEMIISTGAALNITGGGSGITDVVAGSSLYVEGSLNVINGGTPSNGLASLTTVAGLLSWQNGQTLTDTPTGGTLTIISGGTLQTESASKLSITGNVSNSGGFYTTGGSTVTVSGTLTNSNFVDLESSGDVLNVGSLTNTDEINIASGATLNITGGGSGITDVVAGSSLYVVGTLNVINGGTPSNALANLTTVAGILDWENGQTLTDTPSGGTLAISSGGALETYSASKLSVNGNVSNTGGFYTDGGSTVTVSGAFTNNPGGFVYLQNSGDVLNVGSLSNSGEVYITTGATLNLTGGGSGITDVLAGSSLYVAGTLNVVNGGTPSNGLASLTTVAGTLAWENGQTLTDTPMGGTLTINSGGALETYGASTLSVVGSVSNAGDLYTDGGSTVTVSGTLTNSNFVYLESSGDVLNVNALTNTGEIYIAAGAALNLTGGGSGITDVAAGSSLYVNGTLNVINGGTPSNGLANLTTVAGTLSWANGQTLTDTPTGGTLTVNSGGSLEVYSDSTLLVSNLSNSGNLYTDAKGTVTVSGTLTNSGSVYLESSGDVLNVATLTNTSAGTVFLDPGATLNLTGAASTNSKTITLDGGGILEISASKVTISGDGIIDLIGSGSVIEGAASTDVLTLAKGGTIEGSGNIGNNMMGLNNQGIIDAQEPGNPLIIQAVGTTSNGGTMEATVGATLQLDAGTYTQTTAGNILASETGNLLSAVNLESGVVINGGKLTTTGTTATINLVGTSAALTLNGVSISGNGSVQLADGSTTTLMGSNTNTGTIDLNSTGDQTKLVVGAASVTLSGTGKVILASNGDDVITGASSGYILTSANTIEGPGNIGNGMIGVVNTGTIESVLHQTAETIIDADNASAGFNNEGTVEAVAGTTVYIDNLSNQFLNFNSSTDTLAGGTYIVDGTLDFDGANIVTNNASITLSGAASKIISPTNTNALSGFVTNNGTFAIAAGRNFTTIGNFTNNGTLNIGGGTKFLVGTGGTADLTNFSGTTLTGGTYIVTGTLQFNGANIVTNDANITLSGTAAKILNQSSANGLADFAINDSGATFQVTSGNVFTTTGNFTNDGTLIVGSTTSKFIVNATDTLTNFSGTTLTGGTYDVTGLLQFAGANIVTNAANITLTGSTSAIENSTGGNGLANFATNNSGASFDVTGGRIFTTSGSFTNNGTLTVGATTSKFIVNPADSLTNFSGTTLTGGTYNLTGVLEFAGANIVNNAANITLTGTASAIDNSTGVNGLANFANNTSTGSFTLAGNRTFTTVGAFTNAGAMDINKGSTFTVTGTGNNYTQSAGSTTVDGVLVVNALSAVDITGGSLYGATGSITGNVDLTGGVVNPGDGVDLIGELKVTGTYTQGSAGAATIDLGGTTAITQYSVLDITKAASLNGTLNVTLVNGFTPTVGNTFTILDYLSASGTFTTTNLPTVTGDHWVLTYGAKSLVLELESGPGAMVVVDDLTSASSPSPATGTVSASPARRVSRASLESTSTSNSHEPVAILSRVTCFAARLVGSGSCGKAASTSAHGTETALHATSSAFSAISAAPHNNVMVATRSISAARGGASHETSASATAMARLYVCAYLPSTVGHTMGCD